jgi:hypothetical protein
MTLLEIADLLDAVRMNDKSVWGKHPLRKNNSKIIKAILRNKVNRSFRTQILKEFYSIK